MKTLDHKHLILNANVSNPPVDEAKTVDWMRRLVDKIGMVVVIGPHAHYVTVEGNEGITATCCIQTSHISMHCWDKVENPFLRLDIYSCADFDVQEVLKMVDEEFKIGEHQYVLLDRNNGISTKEFKN